MVEFRIKKFAGHKDFKRVNFLVIFSDELEPHLIETQFRNALNRKYKLSHRLSGINWNGLITRESLVDIPSAFASLIWLRLPVSIKNLIFVVDFLK